tara:strand:- start:2219 stop:3160 length:942 start_codon:yes stop_codon:yes gene_type:complete
MVGKLTWFRATSSITCALFDRGRFFDKHDCLARAIQDKNGTYVDNYKQTNRQATGDLLEPVLIKEAARRLGITELEAEVDYKIDHPELPLQASLDGRCKAVNLKIKHNPEDGIYIVGHDELILNGDIPIECKCSSDFPSVDEPPKYLGVDQLHASMDILNADYGILIVLYQSTDLRIYIYKKDEAFKGELARVVLEFDRRIEEEDYYTPETPEHASTIFSDGNDENEKILDADTVDIIDTIEALKETQKIAKQKHDELMTDLMMAMGNHSKARAADYVLEWKTLPAKEAKVREVQYKAAPERRAGFVKIKRVG